MKLRINDAYEAIYSGVSIEEIEYVAAKLPKVYKRLHNNPDDWIYSIGCYAKSMFLEARLHEQDALSSDVTKHVVTALFYLCDPVDVIPDYTPGLGYVDDAFVINECLKRIKKLNSKLYENITNTAKTY